jgi:hypothetical protein
MNAPANSDKWHQTKEIASNLNLEAFVTVTPTSIN